MTTIELAAAELRGLVDRVYEAREQLEAAQAAEKEKSRITTEALNAFNKATKDLDSAMAPLRKFAPWSTEWASRGRGEPV